MSLPFMKLYPSDILGDPKFDLLNYEERGIYLTLILKMWEMAGEEGGDCSLPDDDIFLQRLLKIHANKWKKLRSVLIDGHTPILYVKDGRIYTPWLNDLYAKARSEAERRSEINKRAANIRWERERQKQQKEPDGNTSKEPRGIPQKNSGVKSKNGGSNSTGVTHGVENAKAPLEATSVMRDACTTHAQSMHGRCQPDTRIQNPDNISNIYNTSISPIGSVDGQAADESVSSVSSVNSGGNEKVSSLDAQARAFYEHYCRVWKDVFPRGPRLTQKRLRHIKARLRTFTLDDLIRACDNLHRSPFHRGENDRGWRADLDFLIRSDEQIDKWANNPPVAPLDERRSQRNGVAKKPPSEKIQYV